MKSLNPQPSKYFWPLRGAKSPAVLFIIFVSLFLFSPGPKVLAQPVQTCYYPQFCYTQAGTTDAYCVGDASNVQQINGTGYLCICPDGQGGNCVPAQGEVCPPGGNPAQACDGGTNCDCTGHTGGQGNTCSCTNSNSACGAAGGCPTGQRAHNRICFDTNGNDCAPPSGTGSGKLCTPDATCACPNGSSIVFSSILPDGASIPNNSNQNFTLTIASQNVSSISLTDDYGNGIYSQNFGAGNINSGPAPFTVIPDGSGNATVTYSAYIIGPISSSHNIIFVASGSPGSGKEGCTSQAQVTYYISSGPACPSAQVLLASYAINAGQTTTAMPPAGWSQGASSWFGSPNVFVATVSGNTVTGISPGTVEIAGFGWTAPNGAQSCNLAPSADLTVSPGPVLLPDDATCTVSAPASVVAGSVVPVTITVTNTGSNTWHGGPSHGGYANYYALTISPWPGGTGFGSWIYIDLPTDNIATNQQTTFNSANSINGTVTAPATAGTYTVSWQMYHQGGPTWFFGQACSKQITVTAPPPPPPVITAVSVTPSSGSSQAGASQTFTQVYSDTAGAADITEFWTFLRPSYAANPTDHACYVHWEKTNNQVFLTTDAASQPNPFLPSMTMGQPGTLSNSQCSLDVGASSVVASGNNLTVTLKETFSSAFVGLQQNWLSADNGTQGSLWHQLGSWTVTGLPPSAPSPVSVTLPSCQNATVSWPAAAGATSYNLFYNTTGVAPTIGVTAPSVTNATSGNTYSLPAGTYYFWVNSVGPTGQSAAQAASSNPYAVSTCSQASLTGSDKDIVALNGTPIGPNQQCGGSDPIPASVVFHAGDTVSFAVNLCNSGTGAASSISVVDTLTNLSKPGGASGWNAKYNGSSITPAVSGNQLTFTIPGTIAAANPNPGIGRLTFDAIVTAPGGLTSGSSRFINRIDVTYTGGPAIPYFTTGAYPFLIGPGSPTIREQP